MVADYHGAGVTQVQVLQQLAQCLLLFSRPRVGRLSADVEPALVAHAYGVGVVVLAVGTNHPFGAACLCLSVTPDDVVVAYAELPALPAVPRIYLGSR